MKTFITICFLTFTSLIHAQFLAGDANGDGNITAADSDRVVQFLLNQTNLPGNGDCNLDGTVDYLDVICILNKQTGYLASTAPDHLETDVAVTRETVLRFSVPLDLTTITAGIQVQSTETTIPFRAHPSPDGTSVTLFYDPSLPAASTITIVVDGDQLRTAGGTRVDADGDGEPGGSYTLQFETLSLALVPGTAVTGRVFASEQPSSIHPGGLEVGLGGVRITVDGMEDTQFTTTDALGNFRLDPAPSGKFFVHIDGGATTNHTPIGAYYPRVGKAWEAVPEKEVNIGDIFLPLIREGTLQTVSMTEKTEIGFPQSILDDFPQLIGTMLQVPADSLFSDDGTRGGMVGIAPVDPNRLPGALPTTLALPLVITVQTDGPTNFDRPVPVCFPNLPDPKTGVIAPPGSASALVSFNHDSGRFEVVGSMTVSDDGLLVCSDPGQGVLAPGWHGAQAATSGGGGKNRARRGDGDDDDDPNDPDEDEQDDEDREDEEGKGPNDSPPAEPPNNNPDAPAENKCPPKDDDETGGDEGEDPVDPVYMFSGEFYHNEEDLRIRGRGFDFVWARKYRSRLALKSAVGNSWDFSYNIKLKRDNCGQADPQACPLILYDGNSRRDRYRYQAVADCYVRDEFFRELDQNPDGSFTLLFANRGRWDFNPLDGRPEQGKIQAISDRNGNTMRFEYDGLGRLSKVIDTLDREIVVGYGGSADPEALIQTLTDFTGRVIRYNYYDGTTEDGNEGDLASCTSPAVTGTPHGNDFPNGKTTSYTYQKAINGVSRRNWGNLLTITDGRRNDPDDPTFGQGPWLVNQYDIYDRMVHQEWGGDIVDIYYNPLFPSPVNNFAVKQTIVNDRKGHVKEFFWDRRNRCVLKREYTGTADPTQPTTFFSNLPTNKLRDDDPDYFETRYEWNMDSQKSRVIHPNGNITEYLYERDLNPGAPPRMRGNLRIVRHLPGRHRPTGDQEVIEERYEYDTPFGGGGCCGFNFISKYTDGRGNAVTYDYDARGNLTKKTERIASIVTDYTYNAFGQMTTRTLPDNGSNHRRQDRFTYHTSGPQRGYRHQQIIDDGHLNLTTAYTYDAVGNVVSITDPKGNDKLYTYNALDQVVRTRSREVQNGIRYEQDFHYDANNNLIRHEIENRDETGALQANTHFTTTFEYEILNKLIRTRQEVEEGHDVITEYAYDANRNRTLVRYGEAVNGNQPGNTLAYVYDERDLLFRTIKAPTTARKSTDQFDYDGNGNQVRYRQGLEGTPRVHEFLFDGYNRKVKVLDPMGNETRWFYDANHNVQTLETRGELLDVAGSDQNRLLYRETRTYDPINRLERRDIDFFETSTQAPIADGKATTQYVYNDLSQIVRLINDNNHARLLTYDTANRKSGFEDALGNIVTLGYDANSNITVIQELEKSDLGKPDENFITQVQYDALNRLVEVRDNDDNTHQFGFDSRNNRVLRNDALRPDNLTDSGNKTRYAYDGLNRLIRTTRELTDDGTGAGTVVDSIVTSVEYDDTSRITALVDPNGNRLGIVHDALNRKIGNLYADGTQRSQTFDVHHNVTSFLDANDNHLSWTYDLLNRPLEKNIVPGPGVSDDTTFESYRYDGLSRLVQAEDNDSLVAMAYDSLSLIIRETQNGNTILSQHDGVGNRVETIYPGGRFISMMFDDLDRIRTIADASGMLANYDYIGPGRVEQRDYSNSTRLNLTYDPAKRITQSIHTLDPNNQALIFDQHSYAWDRMYNKVSRTNDLTQVEQQFTYDSIYRLVQSLKSQQNTTLGSIAYEMDGSGNRSEVTGTHQAGAYTLASTQPEPADFQMNQYTTTALDERENDANGNLQKTVADQNEVVWTFDYRNRPTRRFDVAANTFHHYKYDALGRRIEKSTQSGDPAKTTKYLYWHHQVVEERDGNDQLQASYVYGRYIDEVLNMRRGSENYYYHADDLYNVLKVTDQSGTVVESYDYGDYGTPEVRDGNGQLLQNSAISNPYLFNGRRFDEESGFYYYRTRYLDPGAGRFNSRDSIGMWGDQTNLGNGYTYLGNNPWSGLDPFGLDGCDDFVDALVDIVVKNDTPENQRNPNHYPPCCGSTQGGMGDSRAREIGADIVDQFIEGSDFDRGAVRFFLGRGASGGQEIDDFSGFQDQLIEGGQGAAVGRHVAMGSGDRLGGMGIVSRIADFIDGRQPASRTDTAAELAGTQAGRDVGAAIQDYLNQVNRNPGDLKDSLHDILCNPCEESEQ